MTNKLEAHQIDAMESLNQQIVENQVPNAQPYPIDELMSAANDAGNTNTSNDPKQSQESAVNVHSLRAKLESIHYGSIDGDYFTFNMEILSKYRYNLLNNSLELEYTYKDEDKKEVTIWVKLCELIIVNGFVVDNEDRRFFNLDIADKNGVIKNSIIPVDLDSKFLSALYAKGITKHYNRNFNSKIEEFILRVIRIDDRVIKGLRPFNCGWVDSGTYFYPNEQKPVFIGANAENYYFIQSKDKRHISGTLEEWQQNIGKYAVGNPMLEFNMCVAFTGMLMPELGISLSYGFHIYSYLSGTFKSLALLMAGSVMGNREYIQKQWKQTGNNLDLLCALANNNLLVLDEMKQLSKNVPLSEIIMQIGNNNGRGRMAQDGISSRELLRWQLCYLSSGNKATEQYILEREGGDLMGAEETRLYNIQMMKPTNYHDKGTQSQFAKHLYNVIGKYHGIAGYEFISRYLANHSNNKQWLIDKYQAIQNDYNERIKQYAKEIGSSAVHDRIVPAFASVAVAGALAKHLGILPDGYNPINVVWQILMQYLIERGGNIDEQAWLNKIYDCLTRDRNKYFYHGENKPREVYGVVSVEMGEEIAFIVKKCFAEIYGYSDFRKAKAERNYLISVGVLEEHQKDGKEIVIKQFSLHDRGVKILIKRLSELMG